MTDCQLKFTWCVTNPHQKILKFLLNTRRKAPKDKIDALEPVSKEVQRIEW
jgi:hypothetical protein